jgi:HAD superfamily hydrolase (TIGR01509 family)
MTEQLQRYARGIVFDMDGVLIDSHPVHRTAWRSFLRLMGREVSEAELAFILDGRTRSEILRHFFGDIDEEELQEYGKRKDEIFRGMERQIEPVRGVLNFIDELQRRGVMLAVATSASEIRTLSTIERMGLGGCFEAVITASDVSVGKPDPTVYRLACDRIGIPVTQAVAFDDATAGIEAARAAGMRCIGVASNGISSKLIEAGAERVIPDFSGLALDSIDKGTFLAQTDSRITNLFIQTTNRE